MKKFFLFVLMLGAVLFSGQSLADEEQTRTLVNEQSNLEFQVGGESSVSLAKPGSICNLTTEGAMYYDKAQHMLVICNGTSWVTPGGNPLDDMKWYDVKGTRVANVTYTNTTGHTIFEAVTLTSCGTNYSGGAFSINGKYVYGNSQVSIGETAMFAIVPPGATFIFQYSLGCIHAWHEMR